MLMMVGGVQFMIAPLNIHGHQRESATDYVEKPIVGARQPLEYVGEGQDTVSLFGRLFPKRFGGLTGLIALQAARVSGFPQFVIRGDGIPLGWFVIDHIAERQTYLDVDGVGQVIEFDIILRRDTIPGAAGYFSSIMSMFGA